MTQFASDAFAGTSGTELATYSASWTKIQGSTQRDAAISNAERLRGQTVTGSAGYFHSAVPASADYSVSVDIVQITGIAGNLASVIARCETAASTYYTFGFTVGTGWRLFKSVANTFTQLGSTVSATLTDNVAYRCEIRCNGTAISGYVDNVLTVGPITDSSISAAGRGGIRFSIVAGSGSDTTGLHLDNWSADTLAGASFKAAWARNSNVMIQGALR